MSRRSYPDGVAGDGRPQATRAVSRSPTIVAGLLAVLIAAGLAHYALSSDVPNPYSGTHLLIAVTSTAVGAWVARRRPDHPLGWVLLLGAGMTSTWVFVGQPLIVQAIWHGAPSWAIRGLGMTMAGTWIVARGALFIAAPSMVPNGWPRGVRRWVLRLGVAATALISLSQLIVFSQQSLDSDGSVPLTGFIGFAADIGEWAGDVGWFASVAAIVGLAIATARGGAGVLRQQRWFLGGAAVLAVPAIVATASTVWPGIPVHGAVFDRAEQTGSALLPIALLIAVLHDRMLDIAVLVRRVVLYTLLTVASAAVYVAVVGITWIVTGGGTELIAVLGTGAVALAFQPLRGVTQQWVNQRVYGGGDEPYQVLAHLGRRLADVPGSQEALPALVTGIADGLRIPYVAVEVDLERGAEPTVVASVGQPQDSSERFPLVFAAEEIGRLVVGRRTPSEPFRPQEVVLLRDLAQHAGIVAHDALLAADLRRSRLDLVVAREEERRRLRGDLHDGLGPTLASVSLGLDAAAARLDDPELVSLLTDLNADLRDAMQDIRRLVYGLRPPALDELGLVRALESFVTVGARDTGTGPRVCVTAGPLPSLPAAVEVAAYRIVSEAINNARRHAIAQHCEVDVDVEGDSLRLVVRDDGIGIDGQPAGVGMVSMRQRADDLGGHLSVDSGPSGGTVVTANLPLHPPVSTAVSA